MVVSMRPIPYAQVPAAVAITAGMPRVHGAPVQIGTPEAIGITDLDHPDYGDAVTIRPGETPVFWPCGVTPQAVVMHSNPSLHHPRAGTYVCDRCEKHGAEILRGGFVMPTIDLNCDLGESFGAYTIGMDDEILPYVTSANIACGFHAGDPSVMKKSVLLCKNTACRWAHTPVCRLAGLWPPQNGNQPRRS